VVPVFDFEGNVTSTARVLQTAPTPDHLTCRAAPGV
jgi:hypothetical protein